MQGVIQKKITGGKTKLTYFKKITRNKEKLTYFAG
jgi:hypothetical protein